MKWLHYFKWLQHLLSVPPPKAIKILVEAQWDITLVAVGFDLLLNLPTH